MISIVVTILASCTINDQQEYTIIDFESNVSNFKPTKLSELADDLE